MSTVQEQKKFVAFRLNDEYYAIDVHLVNEVYVPTAITEIPKAPNYTAGVINYRGQIVTVIDLKKRLNISEIDVKTDYDDLLESDDERHYVIIVKTEDSVVGLLVDYVESVISLNTDQIQSGIDLLSGKEATAFLAGIADTEYGLTIMLSLDAILSEYDLTEIEKLSELRGKLLKKTDDEIVVEPEHLVDLEKDDIDEWASTDDYSPEIKKIDDDFTTSSTSSSDLNIDYNMLTKAELLKIAIEMKLDGITTRSTKQTIIDAIKKNLGE